jgi:hypothetical protein
MAPRNPWDLFEEVAERRRQAAVDLYEEVKVSDVEIATPWRTLDR